MRNPLAAVFAAIALGAGGVLVATQLVSGAGESEESVFVSVTPCRLVDTRSGAENVGPVSSPIAENATIEFNAHDGSDGDSPCEIPSSATAISANVVAIAPTARSFLSLFPGDMTNPGTANLNFVAGQAPTPNAAVAPLGPDGSFKVFNAFGSVDVVIDVAGFYQPSSSVGATGPEGPAGVDGADGADGAEWFSGAGAPAGSLGDDGDFYLDDTNGDVHEKSGGSWSLVDNLTGPAGVDGADGADGADGVDAESPARVIWVADDGTGDFLLLSAALASITDNSAAAPYVVKIAPGVYTETSPVAMKDHVDVEGSGQGVTTINCACGGSPTEHPAVVSAGNITAEIRHFTVNSTGGGTNSTGLSTDGVTDGSFSMLHITATATGGASYNDAVRNVDSSPTMNHVTAIATSGGFSTGVYNTGSSPVMNDVTAIGTGTGGGPSRGVWNLAGSSPMMNNVIATATGGGSGPYGIYNVQSSSTSMNNVTVTATGASSYGVYNGDDSTVTIHGSSINADFNSIFNNGNTGATVMVADSVLDGPVTTSGLTCVSVHNAAFVALSTTCTSP